MVKAFIAGCMAGCSQKKRIMRRADRASDLARIRFPAVNDIGCRCRAIDADWTE